MGEVHPAAKLLFAFLYQEQFFLVLFLLSKQGLMAALGFLHLDPFRGHARLLKMEFMGSQLFDTWAVQAHPFLYFTHGLKPAP
jgi:hypothetical protein